MKSEFNSFIMELLACKLTPFKAVPIKFLVSHFIALKNACGREVRYLRIIHYLKLHRQVS